MTSGRLRSKANILFAADRNSLSTFFGSNATLETASLTDVVEGGRRHFVALLVDGSQIRAVPS